MTKPCIVARGYVSGRERCCGDERARLIVVYLYTTAASTVVCVQGQSAGVSRE
jgi:hypothetical protein